jgi:CelD/BcsL family acetyltransferase involved in cellulose biosynthesis
VLAWWDALAGRPRTRVAAWRGDAGRLEALVVLSRGRQRLHRRVPLTVPLWTNAGSGAGAADHCAWLASDRLHREVATWIGAALGRSPLLVRGASPGWPTELLGPAAHEVDRDACPRLALPPAPETGAPSKDFERQLRRFTRRIERKGVRFEWIAPGEVDEPLLRSLFELHAGGREGGTFGPEQLPFHLALAARAGTGRGPAAVVARSDDGVAGVLYGFWWRDTFAAYQSGWDRSYARDALGNLLVLHALELAAEHGAETFDFLRGTEPYKYRFGARDEWDRTWLVPRGPSGALLVARQRLRAMRAGR